MRDLRPIALIAASMLLASYASVRAAPDGSGSGSDHDIEMEPDPVGSGSGSAAAASPPEGLVKDPKVAKKWLNAATQLVQKADYLARANKPADAKAQYENAATAYQKSIEAGDDIATYFALAVVEDKLAHDADAYKHLKLVLDPKANAKPDVFKKAQAKLDEVSMKVGLVTLVVKPEGTQIQIAGKDVGESPMTEPLVLDAGIYQLSLIAVGYQPKEAELKVEAGSESQRKIDLEPVKIIVKPHEQQPEPDKPAISPPSKLPMYVGAGVTGGFVVIAAITGIMAVNQHSTFVAPKTRSPDRQDAQANGKTLAHTTDAFLGGAVLAAAFTAYWYQYRYKPAVRALADDKRPPGPIETKNQLVPWVHDDVGGVSFVGSF